MIEERGVFIHNLLFLKLKYIRVNTESRLIDVTQKSINLMLYAPLRIVRVQWRQNGRKKEKFKKQY